MSKNMKEAAKAINTASSKTIVIKYLNGKPHLIVHRDLINRIPKPEKEGDVLLSMPLEKVIILRE